VCAGTDPPLSPPLQRQQKRALEERAAAEKAAARGGAPTRVTHPAAEGRAVQGNWSAAVRGDRGAGAGHAGGVGGGRGQGRGLWGEEGPAVRVGGEDDFEAQIRVGVHTRSRTLARFARRYQDAEDDLEARLRERRPPAARAGLRARVRACVAARVIRFSPS
jgi:hypothetical protein